MELEELREIRACLPVGRTLFYYERGWFQVMLLEDLLKAGWTAPEIRRSNFARLLDGSLIKPLVSRKGKLELQPEDLANVYQRYPVAWRLTLDIWGNARDYRWQQITRKGCNLVLQLNFPEQHNKLYRRYINGQNTDYFNYRGHPVSKSNLTMAWIRLDVDMDNGEVLIEEIQSDWIRNARTYSKHPSWLYRRLRRDANSRSRHSQRSLREMVADIRTYTDDVLPQYSTDWQETVLAAALFFSVQELGIREIYMHDFDTGNKLKNIDARYGLPPRSTYTSLPKKFCFQKSGKVPQLSKASIAMKQKGKKHSYRIKEPLFWHLSVDKQTTH